MSSVWKCGIFYFGDKSRNTLAITKNYILLMKCCGAVLLQSNGKKTMNNKKSFEDKHLN